MHNWNTTTVPNGSRLVRVVIYDAAGNYTNADINVNVSNAERHPLRWTGRLSPLGAHACPGRAPIRWRGGQPRHGECGVHVHGMSVETVINLDRLVEAGEIAQELIGRKLAGKYLQAALVEREKKASRRMQAAQN